MYVYNCEIEKIHTVAVPSQPLIRVFIPMDEPSGARGGTGCSPHNSSVFTLAGAASALDEDNTARQRHQLK